MARRRRSARRCRALSASQLRGADIASPLARDLQPLLVQPVGRTLGRTSGSASLCFVALGLFPLVFKGSFLSLEQPFSQTLPALCNMAQLSVGTHERQGEQEKHDAGNNAT